MRWASVRRAGNAKEEPAPERIRCLAAAREPWSAVLQCYEMRADGHLLAKAGEAVSTWKACRR